MNTLREIPPDAGDEFWDCEALKLMIMDYSTFKMYATSAMRTHRNLGARGLWLLKFMGTFPPPTPETGCIVDPFGKLLVKACKRVSK